MNVWIQLAIGLYIFVAGFTLMVGLIGYHVERSRSPHDTKNKRDAARLVKYAPVWPYMVITSGYLQDLIHDMRGRK